ncbi:hypothetical protein GCM10009105_09450 [Dokdonella soli]|uniref:Uncharacterized protein n=1 Tax=Dokdonella soli TaxID=529810 RepID=A0ABN1IEK1_9GAMM
MIRFAEPERRGNREPVAAKCQDALDHIVDRNKGRRCGHAVLLNIHMIADDGLEASWHALNPDKVRVAFQRTRSLLRDDSHRFALT